MGGAVGRSIARRRTPPAFAALLFVVPTGSLVERVSGVKPPVYEVVTSIDVAASPNVVWKRVISFNEITTPLPWYFRAGIAYPLRATITGEGVGATRRCEFSTGAFIEPITAWEPPRRLAFNVTSQPPPLHELSIYKNVYAPHVDGYFRSHRGEFRLMALPNGHTLLEGHTWYSSDIYPQAYWRAMGEVMLHSIHRRVLDEVGREAVADTAAK
jgi:hypothetical protein